MCESLPNNLEEILGKLNIDEHAFKLADILLTALHKIAPEIKLRKNERKFVWSIRLLWLRRKKKNALRKHGKAQVRKPVDQSKKTIEGIWEEVETEKKKENRKHDR